MAVIGAKGNYAGPGGSFEDDTKEKKEIVCSEVIEFCHETLYELTLRGTHQSRTLFNVYLTIKLISFFCKVHIFSIIFPRIFYGPTWDL